jgi:uncharacterized LabA/DUF88 family protein
MRVALFFDGKNFFRALEHFDPSMEIEYERLAEWVTREAAGNAGVFVGAYYYTGYSRGNQPRGVAFHKFLTGLDFRRGYFVRREPRVARTRACKHCGHVSRYKTEKRVDARLVADMIHFAAVGSYDIAVLFSGDQDLVPGVEAVAALGKQVYTATWMRSGLSPALRARCFGEIELSRGRSYFSSGRARAGRSRRIAGGARGPAVVPATVVPVATPVAVSVTVGSVSPASSLGQNDLRAALTEVVTAHGYFTQSGGSLSEWYFANKWRSAFSTRQKIDLVQALIASGEVEVFDFVDKKGRVTRGLRPTPAEPTPGEAAPA